MNDDLNTKIPAYKGNDPYLEDCSLPPELDLVLNRVHALFKHKDAAYLEHLPDALKEKRGFTALLRSSKRRERLNLNIPVSDSSVIRSLPAFSQIRA